MADSKENHRVHFDKEEDLVEKNNEIMIEKKNGMFDVSLGFLQFKHRYKISLKIPRSLCGSTGLNPPKLDKEPNSCLHVKCVDATDDTLGFELDLFAQKEHHMTEDFKFRLHDVEEPFTVKLNARVLGKGMGTPLLKNGIHLVHEEVSSDSGASSD